MPVLHQKGIVFLLILALWSGSHAQQPSSAPGPQKDFSDEAFIIQNRVERLNFENDGTGTRELTLRVKVQSEAGLQRYGVLQLRYARRTETLEIVFVKVRKPDGAEISTPLESVQEMPSQISREAPFYSDTREKHLPVKGLSVGDVVELKCIWRQTEPLAPGQFWTSVQFERDDIVLSETIQISVPRERAVIVKSPELPPKVSEEGPRRVYTWQRANLERQAPSKLEQAQRVARGRQPLPDILLTSFKSWDEVARWFHELLEERVRPTKEIQEKAAELTRGAADEPAKIQAIYRFVSEEFRYIGVAFGVGRYQPHFAAEVLSNQYGDCKDKHTLLAALLAAAGVNAAPVLINSSRMVDPEVPLPGQFDHLITAVLQKENILWLDSTAEVAPPGYLFALLRDKPALVLTGNKASFATTPVDPPFPSRYVYTMDARLDDTGTLEAKVEQSLRSDEEMLVRGAFRRLPRTQWKDLVQQISYATGFAGEVSDVVVSGLERTDVPLVFSYRYKRKDYPDWKGRRISAPLPLMLMTPAEEGGELPGTFWMGALGEYRFEAKIELPAGWTPELPDKKEFSTASVDFRAEYAFAEGKLTVRCLLKLKQREVHGAAVKEY
ncbi:MAG TPA: DUF3857 domain-containing protein, partial [Candidatus Nitrosotenuis sp.]|nr:DUF3857 domain-containing protein [Candidatus Nitrosotenuis sp.]